MRVHNQNSRGFTIVELLIVVVVIAILAAIVIIAYNGILGKARASAAQSSVEQVVKKEKVYAVENGDQYSTDLAAIGFVNSGDTTYQYSVNNTATPATFCVTVTVADISYFASNTQTSPAQGGCPGHGRGGVVAVTNLATNPSFEATSGTVEVRRNLSTAMPGAIASPNSFGWGVRWFGSGSTGATSTVTGTTPVPGVTTYWRKTWSTVGAVQDVSWSFVNGQTPLTASLVPGQPVALSLWVRHSWQDVSSSPYRNQIRVIFYDSSGAQVANQTSGASAPSAPGVWQHVGGVFTVPANATQMTASHDYYANPSSPIVAGDTLDATAMLIEKSPTVNDYFDGNTSPDIDLTPSWTGAANASASILTGKYVVGASLGGSGRAAFQSSNWATSGTHSVAVFNQGSATSAAAGVITYGAPPSDAGKFFTAVVRAHVPSGFHADSETGSRGMWVLNSSPLIVDRAPLTPGDYTLRISFQVVSGNTVRLGGGGQYGDEMYFDDFTLVQIPDLDHPYTGPPRNGNSPNWIWNGTPNASTSTGPGN